MVCVIQISALLKDQLSLRLRILREEAQGTIKRAVTIGDEARATRTIL